MNSSSESEEINNAPELNSPGSPSNTPVNYVNAPLKNHHKREYFGASFSVVTMEDQEYLIGVQIAHFLKRETFNLYRSMKIKNLDVIRASPSQVDYLVQTNSIKRGTHSVTMVPLKQGISFIAEEVKRLEKLGRKHGDRKKKKQRLERDCYKVMGNPYVMTHPYGTDPTQLRNAVLLEALRDGFCNANTPSTISLWPQNTPQLTSISNSTPPQLKQQSPPAYVSEDQEINRLRSALLQFKPPSLSDSSYNPVLPPIQKVECK